MLQLQERKRRNSQLLNYYPVYVLTPTGGAWHSRGEDAPAAGAQAPQLGPSLGRRRV